MASIPQMLDSISGIDPIFASGILAEPDIRQFKNYKEAAKYAGLAWTIHQSGKFTANRRQALALTADGGIF